MEVEFYQSASGTLYVKEVIDNLPANTQSKIVKILELLEKEGINFLIHIGKMKKIKGHTVDLYELRFHINKIWYRIFCIPYKSKCWLLHIFQKKTNDTPSREISTAITRAKDLLST